MSCVTCDGAGQVDPPSSHPAVTTNGWVLTGAKPTPCPVCNGPLVREMVTQVDARGCQIECAQSDCNQVVNLGLVVYSQLQNVEQALDEVILLCCEDHGEAVAETCRQEGHPTVCLPFYVEDARE